MQWNGMRSEFNNYALINNLTFSCKLILSINPVRPAVVTFEADDVDGVGSESVPELVVLFDFSEADSENAFFCRSIFLTASGQPKHAIKCPLILDAFGNK